MRRRMKKKKKGKIGIEKWELKVKNRRVVLVINHDK
jgi:hypothetical protein